MEHQIRSDDRKSAGIPQSLTLVFVVRSNLCLIKLHCLCKSVQVYRCTDNVKTMHVSPLNIEQSYILEYVHDYCPGEGNIETL